MYKTLLSLLLALFIQHSHLSYGQLVGGDRIFKDRVYGSMIRHKDKTLIAGRGNYSQFTYFTLIDSNGFLVSDTFLIKSEGYEPLFYDIISYGDGYAMAGYFNHAKFVRCVDEKFNRKWETTLFNENEYNQFTVLAEKKNHNIIYVTWKSMKLYVAEIDSNGNKIAENEIQVGSEIIPVSAFCDDDNIYIYGSDNSFGTALVILNNDLSLFKLLHPQNTSEQYNIAIKALIADTNRILLCDASSDFAGLLPYENNLTLTLIDKSGEIIWKQQYTGELPIVPKDIVRTNDGGFLVAGTAYNSPPAEFEYQLNYDYLFIKYSAGGQLLWLNSYGTSRNEYCHKIESRKDGRFEVLASVPNASYYFVIDSAGSRNVTPYFYADPGFYSSHSGHWIDINKDGLTDLFSDQKVFLKQGTGSFKLSQDLYPYFNEITYDNSCFGDFDNDGDMDLFLASSSHYPRNFSLFRNDNDVFVLDTLSGLESISEVNFGSSWIDLNNDGFLDLFTANRRSSYLHINDGKGGFITTKFPDNIIQYSAYRDYYFVAKHQWINFNHDKFADLLLIYSDLSAPWDSMYRARIYVNHAGNFEESTDSCEIISNRSVSNLIWDDLDNDLDDDVMFFDRYYETIYENINGDLHDVGFDPLYFYHKGLSGSFQDIDNDGDKDIFVDKLAEGYRAIYRNDLKFFTNLWDHILTGPFDYKPNEQWVDVNNDGFLDFANSGWFPGTAYLNAKNSNNWIKVRLHGNASNIDGIGAIVKLKSSGNKASWQKRHISDENGPTALFGLGNTTIDSLIVEWPSGCITNLGLISEINKELLITEKCSGIPPFIIDTTICFGASVLLYPENGSTFNWYSNLNEKEPFFKGSSYKFDKPDSSHVYFISNADSAVESRKVPLILHVINPVEVSFIDSLVSINEVRFTNQSKNASDFEWDFGDHTTSELKNPIHIYSNTGIYIVTLKGWNSCFEEMVADTLIIEPTGNDPELFMYPTLFNDKLCIIISSGCFDSEDQLTIKVFNVIGEIVYSKDIFEERFAILNTDSLHAGSYIVVVDNNRSRKIAGKVFKEKF
jgi:hypothetical protein